MQKKLGFGLLGIGLIAPFHVKAIQASDKCELIAVTDLDQDRGRKFSDTYHCKAYGQFDELIQDDAIAVINILTPIIFTKMLSFNQPWLKSIF